MRTADELSQYLSGMSEQWLRRTAAQRGMSDASAVSEFRLFTWLLTDFKTTDA